MQSNRVFQRIGGQQPPRSLFDLSYSKIFDCNAGELIPICHEDCLPGDVWKIRNQVLCRLGPMIGPVMHEINIYVHYFFVPYRLLWYDDTPVAGDWEGFITGGEDGTNADSLPTWTPAAADTVKYSLWDYLGWPVGANDVAGAIKPLAFPMYAYNYIYNEWYRDQWIQSERAWTTKTIVNRNWHRDYFTSSTTSQQKGTAPAFPLSGTTTATWAAGTITTGLPATSIDDKWEQNIADDQAYVNTAQGAANFLAWHNRNVVDFSAATTYAASDIRLAFATQRWLELNARAGSRYTEFLQSHWGVSPRDSRLDRPEYIGGSKQAVVISEVPCTSSTATEDQGNLAGHGLSVGAQHIRNYKVEEHGIIMGLLSIMPTAAYSQGIHRQWLAEDRYDFYDNCFSGLSEQAIYDGEIFFAADATDKAVFGYQGAFDHYRTRQDIFCGEFRSGNSYQHMHLGRHFAAEPSLDSTFLTCTPTTRHFADTTDPGYWIHFQNNFLVYRPMPIMSNPGIIKM